MKSILVTGSAGLIGSEIAARFARRGVAVHGVDNNQRAVFLGPGGDTSWNRRRLVERFPGYHHHDMDVRDRGALLALVAALRPSAVVHAAAQPSHDRAAGIPFDDFDTNAVGTLNLLEAARRHCPEAPFVFLSTNKVYGDRPNTLRLVERPARWELADPAYANGIPEDFQVDQSLHSLFGASKLAADALVQEYGRYFGMPTCCLRAGCLTGPTHSAVELHGFLSYLVRCNLLGHEYVVYGYKGKQVRDNLHAEDVAGFVEAFVDAPRSAEVYNLGGGRENTCSILEAFELVQAQTGRAQVHRYVDQPRVGDHICYYSDLSKIRRHFPRWEITRPLAATIRELVDGWRARLAAPGAAGAA